jgi:hypothetical protein
MHSGTASANSSKTSLRRSAPTTSGPLGMSKRDRIPL